MSEAIKALKALRDAALHFSDRDWCDRAIASLEAAEQPKPDYAFRSYGGGFVCNKHRMSGSGQCPLCFPAEQAQQPARTHCTCAFDDMPGEYPCPVHGEEPTIPLAQHEAALAQARREGLREALALVERDRKRAAFGEGAPGAWRALNEAADGIRALAEKGGEVGKP